MPICSILIHRLQGRLCLLLLGLLLCFVPAMAQEVDSLSVSPCNHSFRAGQLAVPCLLVVAGATGLSGPVSEWKVDFRDQLCEHTVEKSYIDDYVQYAPVAMAVVGEWVGAEAQHTFFDRFLLVGCSYAVTFVLVNGLKYTVDSPRPSTYNKVYRYGNPDGLTPENTPKGFNSFPSGHTATAFMGAELVRMEYGEDNPWMAVAAYAVASGTGFMRVLNDKHWVTDIVAGAGIGMLSARIGWWMLPWISRVADTVLGLDATHGQRLAVSPSAGNGQVGVAMCLSF